MFGGGAADSADKLVNVVLKQLTAVDLSEIPRPYSS